MDSMAIQRTIRTAYTAAIFSFWPLGMLQDRGLDPRFARLQVES